MAWNPEITNIRLFSNCLWLFGAIFAKPNIGSVWLGLIILIVAGAFFKAQISSLVGELYSKNELSKKDAAYSIFYMFINIGAFLDL